ncbi:MAG: hypothetical protein WC428_03975 [Candidatus Paceibacterota bacterium]
MYIKAFEYGHEWELVLDFLKWWIKSDNCSKDIKIGDSVNGGKAVRDIDHTICVTQKGKFELLIEKDAIMSDGPKRKLKSDELYLNKKLLLGGTGFDKSVKKIKEWLKKTEDYDPRAIDYEKACLEGQKFDMVGTGFYFETIDTSYRKILITASVVGIPK